MKKVLKITSMAALALLLAACGNNESTETVESSAESTVESVESVEESSQEDAESATEDQSDASTEETENAETDEPAADAVTFEFYVDGGETPFETFTVDNAEGMSVMEAMENIDGLEFNFNEEDGVIDQIGEYTNDYGTEETWAYLLNGQYAELGVVSQTLEAGDTIAWYYGTSDLIPMNLVPAEEAALELDNPAAAEATEEMASEILEEDTEETSVEE